MTPGWSRAAGAGAALLWAALCIRWFDAASGFRPASLAAWPPLLLAFPAAVFLGLWLRASRGLLGGGAPLPAARGELLFVVGLAILFRAPLAWQGAAGYTTPDGALSGIVAIHVRDGIDHLVFVPGVPYSGSLKSHLTAPLAAWIDTPRAFALVSVLFYAFFVAAVHRLGLLAQPSGERTALAAGLYAAFAPVFVTRYSLSNDGNYVEVLALGTWALVLAIRWTQRDAGRPTVALAAGLLLGLAFWCHILAVIHLAAVAVALLAADPRRALRCLPPLAAGLALGDLPGLLWNAGHGWESFLYLVPGGRGVGGIGRGPGLLGRALGMVGDHWPVLMGYDPGYPGVIDFALHALAWLGVVAVVVSVALALREARRGSGVLRVLLIFTVINLLVAVVALPYIPGNPRYLLFLAAAIPVFLARALGRGRWRVLLTALVAVGALGSLAQWVGEERSDARWRGFVARLAEEGVRFCYTDFYLATEINFLSEERIVCSSELGPTTSEYFREYREKVGRAPEAALIAVNAAHAEKLERRLQRLGVSYERRDLMKPVLLRLSRKVVPRELFPDRSPY